MAVTRREFVTTLAAVAGAMGMSQASIAQLSQAFAGNLNDLGGTHGKPRVVWLHGAECTGCSVSVLSFLEDPTGEAIHNSGVSTAVALGLAGMTDASLTDPGPAFTLGKGAGSVSEIVFGAGSTDSTMMNIADVVIDLVDIQYHETIMGMGGDLAAQWLDDFIHTAPDAAHDVPFVLVVEGALADKTQGGAWNDLTDTTVPWCSIGMTDDGSVENDFADCVLALAQHANCAAIVPVGQCATYGGYPGCKPQITTANAGFDATKAQSGAMGVYEYLNTHAASAAAGKVYNVPGCPTNPWWFGLTVVMIMINIASPGAVDMTRDSTQRLKAVFPLTVHSSYCPHIGEYNRGEYALKPGDAGCLQKLGCKGIAASSLCGIHGWNNQQPENTGSLASLNHAGTAGHCTQAGAPCMACSEKGYPDSFVPFVKRS